ncbi:MAG: FecR domain-containing protein [Sulfuricurvum sp.]|uniref:FecR family protein n=1 Tax=Sulfuricurvum sp. TaxID=2025608 RepID=UPI00260348A8|nr:FecR domain-containing protein [Sulfuricurvum sp.]MDD2828496.1 FecR domain-containing protein [Sulfuricurvum sp.]MDD4948973.1 FecR domain-containing protein [Sulfuricurvum sp.]
MKSAVLMFLLTFYAFGAESVAFIKSISGEASVMRNNLTHPLQQGEELFSKDELITGKNSTVGLSFDDGTRISIGANTHFKIDDFLFAPAQQDFKFNVSLPKGSLVFESGKIGKLAPEKVGIKVPQGIIGIRGTKFIVEAE